jgi:hypothetical protein
MWLPNIRGSRTAADIVGVHASALAMIKTSEHSLLPKLIFRI